jgi:YebC/PmpR family DNA-binding regulatory protein
MSGHSKWSTIKRKKGATDAKRGKIFTKLIKEITVSARMGGGDPNANPRLRTAIAAAKADNMPKDNIERAIKKGTGALEGVSYEEVYYEGYGPGGAAVLVESFTDNKNRTVADVRHLFSKSGGGLGEAGCVAWMFEKKGLFVLQKEDVDEETLMEAVLDAGGEDIRDEDTTFEVTTAPEDFEAVKKALDDKELKYLLAEVTMVPKSTVKLEDKEAEQMLRLMESLEDSDDVQKVYSNFDIPEETLEKIGGA